MEDINLRIIDNVAEAGTGFAFPSQTSYISRDQGLDPDRAREAEARVQAWRLEGRLPFPDFDEGSMKAKVGDVDYSPKGSPDYNAPRG